MKAPFPWFGGKRRVAPVVWDAFGDVANYTEPFAGSLAVLLERPHWPFKGGARIETVNDMDAFVVNFWRAVQRDPDAVAVAADNPVNECDLHARHQWLHGQAERVEHLKTDPDWFDARVAGYWCWGLSSWIGDNWCRPNRQEAHPHLGAGLGVNRQLTHLERKLHHLGDAGQGVNRALSDYAGANVPGGCADRRERITAYMHQLCDRLRSVRVCCGDWSRIVTDGALSEGSTIGVFLDPPYRNDIRDDVYSVDGHNISDDVCAWCIAHGDYPRLRIALCGYEEEHKDKMPATWRMHKYKAGISYGTKNSCKTTGGNAANRHKERIWFSPSCVRTAEQMQMI